MFIELIKDNIEIITVIFFVIMVILNGVIISFNKFYSRYFSNKKFRISSSYVLNPLDQTKEFSIKIYNSNINDIRISGFGYVYKSQNIDFYHTYLNHQSLPKDYKVVISSRDYLSVRVDMNQMKMVISDINEGKIKVDSIKAYVTDSLGFTTLSKANQVKTQIQTMLNYDRQELNRKKKEQIQKIRFEHKAFRKKERVERTIKRKEVMGKWIFSIKNWFKKLVNKNHKPNN